MGNKTTPGTVSMPVSEQADQQHLAWLARSFGRSDYAPLTASDLEVLLPAAQPVTRFTGAYLYREGDPAAAAFLIESGEVEVYRGSGASRRVVSRAGPGSILGDIAMFGSGFHFSSARVVHRVHALVLDRERLLPELTRHPSVCLRWLVSGIRQLEKTQRRVIRLMHKTVLGQVADLLVEEADLLGEVHLSQTTLATLLGVSRQSVNEALGRLRDQHAVETGYRQIRVLDVEKLKLIASS